MTLVGRTLGKYRLVERVGSGALADVYRGLQIGLERTVVVKVLPPALAADAVFRARFRRSGLATARLSHPNVITIFDSGEEGGVPYTVMEELRPASLEDTLEHEGALPWTQVLKVGHDVAKALVYAHGRGVCHGSLSPACVKFDQRQNAILTDFARADDGASEAADVLALAGILHAALTGQLEAHPAKRAAWREETPAELAAFVDGALASGHATARDFLARLKDVELRLRARHVSRAMAALPPAVLEDDPPMPLCESSDSLGFLESLSSIISDDGQRGDVVRAFSWAAPVFLITLCGALMLFH